MPSISVKIDIYNNNISQSTKQSYSNPSLAESSLVENSALDARRTADEKMLPPPDPAPGP
jgi:hypothetical protein